MKTVSLIIMILLLMGCKTKKVLKSSISEVEQTQISFEKKEEKQIKKIEEKQETKKIDLSEQKQENQTETEIKGKAEAGKPLEIFHVENGDTLQAFKITGNAEVHIRTKTSKSDHDKKENSSQSFTDKLKDFSNNIVEESDLKKRVSDMKKRTQDVTSKTGTFWSFGLVAGLGSIALIIIGLIIYLKR